jgi:HD-GYP domain-containing protein (c-di-GMP phosphodiesterase class II)
VLRTCAQQLPSRSRNLFDVAIDIAEGHHEKFDGSGYPHRLARSDIPLAARIVALADVFDALTSRRPYKAAWPIEAALAQVRAAAGSHFDPAVVAAMEAALPQIRQVYAAHKHV